ncbi:24235_t:CDS:2, partial [Cetraspora pellucida]
WTIAEECPTNTVPVAPNAKEGNPIVLAEVQSKQRLYQIKKHYPIANKYVKILEIRALRQGIYKSVLSFWAKIQKYGNQLGYTPAQKKTHFLSRVRPDIRDEIYKIGQTKPINDIINSLAELELYVIPQQLAFPMANMQKIIQDAFAKQQTESKAKIKKLKAKLQAQQPQVATSEKSQQAFYIVDQEGNNIDPLTQDSNYLKYLEQAKALYKKPQKSNQFVRMNRIEKELNKTQNTINQLADQLQKKVYIKKYGICGETGHSKGKCPNQLMV